MKRLIAVPKAELEKKLKAEEKKKRSSAAK